MQRPKFTIRGMMIAVALVALASGLGLWVRRVIAARDLYREYFAYHQQELRFDELTVREFELDRQLRLIQPAYGKPDANYARKERVAKEGVARHAMLKRRYESAVLRPWESVILDPPDLKRAKRVLRSVDEGPDLLPPDPPGLDP